MYETVVQGSLQIRYAAMSVWFAFYLKSYYSLSPRTTFNMSSERTSITNLSRKELRAVDVLATQFRRHCSFNEATGELPVYKIPMIKQALTMSLASSEQHESAQPHHQGEEANVNANGKYYNVK